VPDCLLLKGVEDVDVQGRIYSYIWMAAAQWETASSPNVGIRLGRLICGWSRKSAIHTDLDPQPNVAHTHTHTKNITWKTYLDPMTSLFSVIRKGVNLLIFSILSHMTVATLHTLMALHSVSTLNSTCEGQYFEEFSQERFDLEF
jgi:hypothetical protein